MTEISLVTKVTVIFALALVGTRLLVGARASIRALLLASAFGVVLVLPAATFVIPQRSVEIPATYLENVELVLERLDAGSAAPPAASQPNVVDGRPLPSVATVARWLWVLGTVALLTRLGVALVRLRNLRRTGLSWPTSAPLVRRLRALANLRREPEVFLHETLSAPMTFGLRRSWIGLPSDAPAWEPESLRHALIHEFEHVKRADWIVHVIAHVVCSIYWFHPLVWMAARRLCLDTERACDDVVLRESARDAYAEQLVTLARRMSKRSPVAVLSMADRSDLSARVGAILDSRQRRGPAGRIWTLAIVSVSIALLVTVSPLRAVSRMVVQRTAQAADTFEVAAIRPSPPGATRDLGGIVVRYLPGGRLTAVNAGLLDLVTAAYRVQFWQLAGGPNVNLADGSWINPDMMSTRDRYNIEASAGRDATQDEMHQMLQALLADRFRLVVRRETRNAKAYELVVDPGGHKLQSVTVDKYAGSSARSGGGRLLVERMTMPELARYLQGQVQTAVVDRTGLTGIYRFNVVWTPEIFRLSGVGRPPENGEPGIDPNGPSIFDALREQAGLRLRESTGPVEHLILEQAERPSPNDARQPPPGPPQGLAGLVDSPTTGPNAPRFEVASIKRNPGPTIDRGGMGGMSTLPTGQVRTTNIPLRQLIRMAYGLRMTDMVLGGPDWIDDIGFDVDAKPEGRGTVERARLMLRTLLAERFKLVLRREPREMPVYALTVARTDGRLGPHIQRPVGECVMIVPGFVAQAAAGRATVNPLGAGKLGSQPPLGKPGRRCGMGSDSAGTITAGSTAISGLITLLTPALDRPVIDRTGLTGTFDFDLRYAGAGIGPGRGRGLASASTDTAPEPSNDLPSIFTALPEQLGLKLEPQRAPVDVLVVYEAELPTEN